MDPSAPELIITQAHSALCVDENTLHRIVLGALLGEGVQWRYLSFVFTDHATIRDLNRDFLGHDYMTDVLSFDLSDEDISTNTLSNRSKSMISGEVYIDLDTATERHAEFGTSFEEEALRYAVHGLLHLVGYDDDTPEKKAHMHHLEDKYLGHSP